WRQVPGRLDETLEAAPVDRLSVELEHVARRPRDDHVRAEQAPELGDVSVQRRRSRARRLRAPERLDELVDRDDGARPAGEEGERDAPLERPEPDHATVPLDV